MHFPSIQAERKLCTEAEQAAALEAAILRRGSHFFAGFRGNYLAGSFCEPHIARREGKAGFFCFPASLHRQGGEIPKCKVRKGLLPEKLPLLCILNFHEREAFLHFCSDSHGQAGLEGHAEESHFPVIVPYSDGDDIPTGHLGERELPLSGFSVVHSYVLCPQIIQVI